MFLYVYNPPLTSVHSTLLYTPGPIYTQQIATLYLRSIGSQSISPQTVSEAHMQNMQTSNTASSKNTLKSDCLKSCTNLHIGVKQGQLSFDHNLEYLRPRFTKTNVRVFQFRCFSVLRKIYENKSLPYLPKMLIFRFNQM